MIAYDELLKAYKAVLDENIKLKKENATLRQENDMLRGKVAPAPPQKQLSTAEKVALFRGLFKGREDVFARRWHSKTTDKSGYQPVCTNEWEALLCDKRKYKCSECPNRSLKAIEYQDIYNHLAGKDEYCRDVIGIYAITEDNKCHFLCADFDDKSCKHGYKDDVIAYVSVCKEWRIPCSIERSRSGNGAHVWIFFSEAVAAKDARQLGFTILTEATNRNGRMAFESYDRFFPNQNYLNDGGFGNLVALPMQGKARKNNNSVFVDETFSAYPDQWNYLQGVQRIDKATLHTILNKHSTGDVIGELSSSSESKPWERPADLLSQDDFKQPLEIIRADSLYISTKGTSQKLLNHIRRLASFRNPDFYAKQAMRLPTYNIPRIISCADILDEYIAVPRGCEDDILQMAESHKAKYNIVDKTQHGHTIKVSFKGILRPAQKDAVDALSEHNNGVINATTAFGKTITAIGLIAMKKVNTLILVHTKALLEQWKARLAQFLDTEFPIDEDKGKRGRKKEYSPFGTLDSRGSTLHCHIDIALLQSCSSGDDIKQFIDRYGMVIVDECHHVSAVNFEQVLKKVKARYVYGLTATAMRKDGHQPIIFMQCGQIRYSADSKSQMASQNVPRFLVPRFTSLRITDEQNPSYTLIAERICEDTLRNAMIVDDICSSIKEGRTPIVLSRYTAHVETIAGLLKDKGVEAITLVGSDSVKQKREKMEYLHSIPDSSPLVIVATDKYVGEGFDFPRLDTLFMTMPISWHKSIEQYVGRLHREYADKTDVKVYDYIDFHIPMCNTMYKRRMRGYRATGYVVADSCHEGNLFNTAYNSVFGVNEYTAPMIEDFKSAKTSITLALESTYVYKTSPIYKCLKDCIARGVLITAIARKSSVKDDVWIELGITAQIKNDMCLSSVIVDNGLVWYGDINFLGFNEGDETALRLNDQDLANEIIELISSLSGEKFSSTF